MSGKGRFHIPSSSEMEQGTTSESVKSLFQSHQSVVKANIKNKTPADDSFASRKPPPASGLSKAAHGSLPGPGACSTNSGCVSSSFHQSTHAMPHVQKTVQSVSASSGPQLNEQNSFTAMKANHGNETNNLVSEQQQKSVGGLGNSVKNCGQFGSNGAQPRQIGTTVTSRTTENVTKSSSGLSTSGVSDQPSVAKNIGATPVTPPRPGGNASSLIVSTRQRGNPVLKFIRNVPWEYGDIVPDYVMSQSSCALFLSLRYHQLNNNYVHERLKQLGHSFVLRVLLVQVDIKDPHHCLKELAKICLLSDSTLILAWSPEEAGRYLETYKSFENKPPDLIMEKTETNFLGRVTDFLTSARKVNKTDAMTLLSTFGKVEEVIQASEEDMSLCPGFGPQKAKRLHHVLHEPFLKAKKKKTAESPDKGKPSNNTSNGAPTEKS